MNYLKKNDFITRILACIIVIVTASCSDQAPVQKESSASKNKRPNVVWILLDALRAENLSCYGYERLTSPNLDKLATRGALFEQTYSQYFKTRTSVPQYMTGRFFPVPGFEDNNWRVSWRERGEEELYISEILRDNGYRTVLLTTHGFFEPGSRIYNSFDEVNPEVDLQRRNLAMLKDTFSSWLNQNNSDPFFAYIHALDTHFPHHPEPPHDRWLDPDHPRKDLHKHQRGSGQYSKADQEYLRGLYDGSISYTDLQIGALMEILFAAGELENTLIIISSDHGETLAEDGKWVGHYESITADQLYHVPLIMAGPGIQEGGRFSALTQNVDIVPTLIELLGLDTKARSDGKSLASLLRDGQNIDIHNYIYSRSFWAKGDIHILRDAEAKYVYSSVPEGGKPREELWSVPDRLGNRHKLLGETDAKLAQMRDRMTRDILPRLEKFEALPLSEPQIFVSLLPETRGKYEDVTPAESYIHADDGHDLGDDKWTITRGTIMSSGNKEDSPPIKLTFRIPNEHYRIQMELSSNHRFDGGDGYASAFMVKAQNDSDFHHILYESKQRGSRAFVTVGDYEVSDGTFVITLDEGSHKLIASGARFRFIPNRFLMEQPDDVDASQAERLERLEALGYL